MTTRQRFVTNELPGLAGLAGAAAIRQAISAAYEARKGVDPPTDPSLEGVTWREALLWTALLAAGAAIGRLLLHYLAGEAVNRTVGQRQQQG